VPTLQTVVGEAQTNNMDGFFAKQQKHMFDNDVRPLLLLTVFAIKIAAMKMTQFYLSCQMQLRSRKQQQQYF